MKLPLGEVFSDALERAEQAACEDLARAAPPALAEKIGLDIVHIAGTLMFICRNIGLAHFNWITPAGRLGDDGAAVSEGVRRFREAGVRQFLVMIPPGPHEERCRALAQREGLSEHSAWSKFVRRTDDPPAAETRLEVREAEDAGLFAATVVRGYGLPDTSIAWLAQLVGRPRWKTYLSYDGGKPIGGATLFVDGPIAWFGADATLPEGRNRGSQTALLARRIADARALGAEFISGEAEVPVGGRHATSHANILKAGFTIAYRRANWAP